MPTTTDRITKTPDVCGGQACIRGTRVPVWILAEWQRLGKSDAWILEGYPHITLEDLHAAFDYAAAYPDEIAEVIRLNDEA